MFVLTQGMHGLVLAFSTWQRSAHTVRLLLACLRTAFLCDQLLSRYLWSRGLLPQHLTRCSAADDD